ncbi:E3 ubiquitin-protein ligase ZFP91-like isoform X1 [Xyrauchen texanus]|uniref:E3 ubiquitin-protein ligase ZFP91-like isoform X1 n=1 Tax=Xyrauchen texanus TaxID=154827 RepID=UPI002241EB52|nr:E3 ubiquitin-protein ligase ZFP91-like isoform X1 [Xyrauchen texanus]
MELSNNNDAVESEMMTVEKSAGQSTPSTPHRASREGDGYLNTERTCSTETDRPASSLTGSGRVLRDRSMRTLPLWRQSDIGEDEVTCDAAANRRRKASFPRRRRNTAAAAGSLDAAGESSADCGPSVEFDENKDSLGNPAARSRRPQVRTGGRTCRGSPKTVFKIEPDTDSDYVVANTEVEKTGSSVEKKEDESMDDDDVMEEDDSSFVDDPKDQNYLPYTQSEEEDAIISSSSEEDVPFTDDLNDQSYDPKCERDPSKPRRRPPRGQKEKAAVTESSNEQEPEIKTEGAESTDEKIGAEFDEDAELPRKRGRRKKDDKSPRLPKRRKKPPIQYVRCEMEGCGTVLAHPRYLQHHIKYQHLMKKKYVCPYPSCGRLFRLQKQLLRHAKHHTDQRDYICEFCARAFKSSHNLAVHRMIHTGEKPLQCEICGFTCRQKASLNWHMKKHDADATYQFSCSICGKKFEKKDSVVAHKAKSHPEVLIAEALAANAGALITTPDGVTTLLGASTGTQTEPVVPEAQKSSVVQGGQVGPLMVVGQEHTLHTMQVPVGMALSSTEENGNRSQQASTHSLQMPLQFITTPVLQQQHQIQQLPLQTSTTITEQAALVQQMPAQSYNPQIDHMAFRAQQQHPLLSVAQQMPLQTTQPQYTQAIARPPKPNTAPNISQCLPEASSDGRSSLEFGSDPPSSSSTSPQSSTAPSESRQVIWVGDGTNDNENGGVVWEVGGEGEEQSMTDSSDGQMERVLI